MQALHTAGAPADQSTRLADASASSTTPWRWMLGVAALAALVRLVPAALTFGTSDVVTWELLGRMLLDGENFYATQLHNWPALWIYFCAAAIWLHDTTGVPFSLLIKLPPIAADALISLLLMSWTRRRSAGLAYALNPVAILITGYHGQFDALMLAPTVLATLLFTKSTRLQTAARALRCARMTARQSGARATPISRNVLLSALAIGLGIWFKPVPFILLPLLLPRLATWRDRLLYTVLAVAPAILGTLPYFVQWPQDVAANFLGYSSWFGQWGYAVMWMVVEFVTSGTVPWWLPDPDYVSAPLHAIYVGGKFVLIGALCVTWWLAFRRRMDLLRSITVTFAVFYFATSGFGVQYLLWIVPFAIARRDRWLWPFTVAATLLLLVAYTLGRAYLPLPEMPDNGPSLREFAVKLATLPAWLICGLWAWSLLRRPQLSSIE